jgi:Ca2+-binding RTX toxin-like protein
MPIITGNAATATNDLLIGTAGSDTVTGHAGNDTLRGGGGNDVIVGGTGGDVLSGGLGADSFMFKAGDMGRGAARDRVTDFQDGVDKILLDAGTISPKATTVSDLYGADGTFLGARIETTGLGNTFGPEGGSFIDVAGIHAVDLINDVIWV